jgi:hypothetical protein
VTATPAAPNAASAGGAGIHEELKQHILKSPVLCIDEGDVTRWHLHKHKREAEAFLSGVDARTFSSDLALTYPKRLKKVGSKLFTFLDYDGVPWNNNGAEHAVKSFMKFKRTSDGWAGAGRQASACWPSGEKHKLRA